MADKIGAEQARQHLPELLERARAGEVTIICKRGKPYAALVPLDHLPPEPPTHRFTALLGSGPGLWGDDPAEHVRRMREEWS